MKTHSSVAVANYIIDKAMSKGNPLTPMQVIKLVYLCHGWMLGLYNRPLINEPVEAWQYGPVIKNLYQRVKQYRSNPILDKLDNTDSVFSEEEQDVMDQVINKYSSLSGVALSSLTHADGTPWSNTWNPEIRNVKISNDLIEDHFKEIYSKTTSKAEVSSYSK